MHDSSMRAMEDFLSQFPKYPPRKILDVGSRKIKKQRTYKSLIPHAWDYIGIDTQLGPNVDRVLSNPYDFPFLVNTFDLVISGQTLEHVGNPTPWMQEIYRVLKPNGSICIIAPSAGPQHCRPDYRRILSDGMRKLFEITGFKDIQITMGTQKPWFDCIGEARK